MTTKKGAILASPLLCLGVLTVIAADNARHVKPKDAEPYHARARKAIYDFPRKDIPSKFGIWTSEDTEVPAAAIKLLRPNALISRRYTNDPVDGWRIWAHLLISQCNDSNDMRGHYPPRCYPSNGEEMVGTPRAFHLKAGDIWIDGNEYQFLAKPGQGCERKSVYNFFVIPGRGVAPDIKDLQVAARDYERRYFGAAQFQVIIDADQPPEVRDNVFTTLIGADTGLIKTLEKIKD